MVSASPPKATRVTLSFSAEDARVLAGAAAFCGRTLKEFVKESALNHARKVLKPRYRIKLSERDSLRVIELLENPPPPPEKLLAVMRRVTSSQQS